MGAYLIKFPRARIVTLVFIFFFLTTLDIPAAFLLLYWFAIQFFSGVGSVGYSQASSGGCGLVRAHWRIPGRHGLDSAHVAAAAALPTVVLKCFSK